MSIEYLKKHPIIVFIVIVALLYFLCSIKTNEGMENMPTMLDSSLYNPNSFQPGLAREIGRDKFVELNQIVDPPWANDVGNNAKYGEVDALLPARMGLNYNLCSKSCCSQQWPVPFSLAPDKLVTESGKEYVPSSYTCNNAWQDTGCLCMEKDQALFLNSRGMNDSI